MPRRRVLVQWIGHNDLRSMAASLPEEERASIMGQIRGIPREDGNLGPIKTLVESESFDEILMLSNYPKEWNAKFSRWLNKDAKVVSVDLQKPTDYTAIFRVAEEVLKGVRDRSKGQPIDLCLHLSPGTPAMAAVWLLLGKTRYPATFYETYRGKSWVTEVPFDLTMDVLPEILRNPDYSLQRLASRSPREVEGFGDIIGESTAIRDAVGKATRAAVRSINILLLGESGTGKEMFAQAIHKASSRRNKPFLPINCAAISKTLLESELFGHAKGAFTGAERERKGAFEEANGGTLFLDEVGECDLETQAKLLRVLQPLPGESPNQRTFKRLGDDRDRKADVRIIAATNRDLHAAIRNGEFREDLYYRLAVISISLPPLRDRKADIPLIAGKLLEQINQTFQAEEPQYSPKSLSDAAMAFVKRHDWPGNVRQLYNALVQAAVLTDGDLLEPPDLVAALGELPIGTGSNDRHLDRPIGDGFNLEAFLEETQRSYLRRAMEEARGVKAQAARLLGIGNYQTLDAQLKRLNVTGNWGS